MSVTAVIGAQWGDEGKGKITDLIAQDSDMVIRFNGGNNAGHTIQNEHGEFKLHIVPAGIFNNNTVCIIGTGTAVHIPTLLEELSELKSAGIDASNLYISKNAHLVMPWHIAMDEAQEQKRSSSDKIGTTKRGMGPVFSEKYSRTGLRVGDILNPDTFRSKFEENFYRADKVLRFVYGHRGLMHPPSVMFEEFMSSAVQIFQYIHDTELLAHTAVKSNLNILLEGAQAVLLDINHGSYPFVTSSECGISAAAGGSGIPPSKIDERIAVVKAYSTRIGPGAFPSYTEGSEIDKELRNRGNEYGATTGRPRMCGWIDLPLLRYANRLNDFTSLAITKIDVLSGINPVYMGFGYLECSHAGKFCIDPRCGIEGFKSHFEPVAGWNEDISSARSRTDLPKEADNYVKFIEDAMGNVPAKFISVGPERNQTIIS